MNNLVNKLNEYLKIFNADGIRFDIGCTSMYMWIMLPVKSPQKGIDLHVYRTFDGNDEFFEKIPEIYNDIATRRENTFADLAKLGFCRYSFAYHMVNTGALSFLKMLSSCSSLKEFELKLQVMGYDI
jgi:hypothetical protein